MDTTKAQQIALDDALVAPANHALKLTPFYKAFEVTANVPKIYMQEFWATICPRLPGQKFEDPPFEEEILSFIRDLGHTGEIKVLTDVNVNHMHQPWRSFVAIINRCLSGKTTGLDSLRLSRAQIIWGMYNKKNVDYVYLLWEDLIYGSILPNEFINQEIKDSKAYKQYYAIASRAEPPKAKTKYKKKANGSDTSSKLKFAPTVKGKRLKTSGKVTKSGKKRQSASVPKAKGLETLSEVALSEHEQMKIATKRSKTQFHSSHASGSGDGADTRPEVPDEQQQKDGGTDKGVGDRPEQRDDDDDNVAKRGGGEDLNDEKDDADDDDKNDSEETESDDDGDEFVHPNLSTYKADDQEEEKIDDDDEVSFSDQNSAIAKLFCFIRLGVKSHNLVNVLVSVAAVTPSSVTIIPQHPVLIIQTLQQTPDSTTTPPYPITTLPEFPNFASLFAVSSIPDIVDNYLASKMKDEVDVAIQLQLNKLKEEAQAENEEFLSQIDSNIKAIIKDQVKAQVSNIFPKVEKYVTESLGAEVLVRSTNQPQTSYTVAASLSEFELKKIVIDKIEENKSMNRSHDEMIKTRMKTPPLDQTEGRREGDLEKKLSKSAQAEGDGQKVDDLEEQSYQEFNTGNDNATHVREVQNVNECQWNPSSSPTPDREWHTTKSVDDRPPQTWITQLA
ncbi:hypothetical protein Tco_0321429 [Tanacetum coccineum]